MNFVSYRVAVMLLCSLVILRLTEADINHFRSCYKCLKTYRDGKKNVTLVKDKGKYCSVLLKFITCSKAEKCNDDEQDDHVPDLVPTIIAVRGELIKDCGYTTACNASAVGVCTSGAHKAIKQKINSSSAQEGQCMLTKVIMDCLIQAKCVDDIQFIEIVKFIKKDLNDNQCQCSAQKADICLAELEQAGYFNSYYLVCEKLKRSKNCIYQNGCANDELFAKKLASKLTYYKKYYCEYEGGLQIRPEPKSILLDGAALYPTSWVIILLAATGIYGQL